MYSLSSSDLELIFKLQYASNITFSKNMPAHSQVMSVSTEQRQNESHKPAITNIQLS